MTEQSRHESPELGAMIGRMLNGLIRRAAEGDTEAIEQLQAVEQLAGTAYTAGLAAAHRAAGYSLGELAQVTGHSRQNVRQRVARAGGMLGAVAGNGTRVCDHVTCTGRRTCKGEQL